MSISKRQEQILSILNERSFITVAELSTITFTSPSSIRRDLSYLQNNGFVKRTHGGVSSLEPMVNVASYYDRLHKNANGKRSKRRFYNLKSNGEKNGMIRTVLKHKKHLRIILCEGVLQLFVIIQSLFFLTRRNDGLHS